MLIAYALMVRGAIGPRIGVFDPFSVIQVLQRYYLEQKRPTRTRKPLNILVVMGGLEPGCAALHPLPRRTPVSHPKHVAGKIFEADNTVSVARHCNKKGPAFGALFYWW
jgi:hypothetical protein